MSELASPPTGGARLPEPDHEPIVPAQAGPTLDQSPPDPATDGQSAGSAATEEASTDVIPRGTTAGTLFAGRYRLINRVGTDPAAGAEFWRAEDTVLQRDVAVTVLRRLGAESGEQDPAMAELAEEMVTRALRSGSFEHRGCARLLDVLAPGGVELPRDVLGVAVTEWVPGKSLTEAVSSGLLKPLSAARAVAPLAAAAEAAHLHGLVLGVDHPQRVRVTPDGRAQLGFALPRPDTTPADDVRGLGAVLYTLLTSHWPLARADAARAGLTAAERDARATPVAPSTQRPGVPMELDALAVGTLGPEEAPGHVHTAASVHALLAQVVEEDDRVALFPPVPDGAPADPGDVWQDRSRVEEAADPRRRRKLVIGLVALAIAVVAVLGFVGFQVGAMFTGSGSPAIVVGDAPVGPSDTAAAPVPGASDALAAVASVDVYDPTGSPDNPNKVSRVIDGDPTSGWNTSRYDQQFPAYKKGIGVMSSFASAVQLSHLSIVSPSQGTVVEIRSAPEADSTLAETTLLSTATLGTGTTDIPLSGSQPVTHVLVWITKLGPDNSSEIDEVQFHRASG